MPNFLFDAIMEKLSDSADKKKCNNCNGPFWFYTTEYFCEDCNNIVCYDCQSKPRYLYKTRICSNCNKLNWHAMSKILIVKSQHIGGHKMIKNISNIESSIITSDYNSAIDNLKYLASKLGANGIISFQHHKSSVAQTSENGKGTYYRSIFSSSGIAVLVEKNISTNQRNNR